MLTVLTVLVLFPLLLMSLHWAVPRADDRPDARPRPGSAPPGTAARFAGTLAAPLVLPAPVVVLAQPELLTGGRAWLAGLLLLLGPLAAVALVRTFGRPERRGELAFHAGRAGLLLAAVAVVELLVLLDHGPLPDVPGTVYLAALVTTVTVLGVLRATDQGYWPRHLVSTGWTLLVAAVVLGGWNAVLDPASVLGSVQPVSLLVGAALLAGAFQLALGHRRLARWMRDGPPEWPPPPGVRDWPPGPGEVWWVVNEHDNGTHKRRPVLVWERTPTHVAALTITSIDKSARPRDYLPLSLAEWEPVLTKTGWLSLEITPIPFSNILDWSGYAPDGVWNQLRRRQLVRPRRPSADPAPGFSPAHLRESAHNRYVGPYDAPAATPPARPATIARKSLGEPLLRGFVWLFAGPGRAFFLSAPSVALLFAFRYPQQAIEPTWALCAVAPLAAVLIVWRSDGLRRPVRWAAVLTRAAVLGALCVVTGSLAGFVAVDSVAASVPDPAMTWLVVSMLAVVVVWFTLAVCSPLLRRRHA